MPLCHCSFGATPGPEAAESQGSWGAFLLIPGPGLRLPLRTLTVFSEKCLSGIENSWPSTITGRKGGKATLGWMFFSKVHRLQSGQCVWAGEWAPERVSPVLATVVAYPTHSCLQTSRQRSCSGLPKSLLHWLLLCLLLRCRACLLSCCSECECSSRGPAPAVLLWIKALLNSQLPGLQSKLQPCTIYLGKSRTRLMICKVDLLFGCLLWQLLKVLC